jgi:hypothetical protein
MSAKITYDEIKQAIESGKVVQLCMIDQNRHAVKWEQVHRVNYNFDPGRYRIIDGDRVIDGTYGVIS